MSSLLTLEDYNSVNMNPINEYYELDTSLISLQEFENVLYDFCIVSHSINGNNHTFTFEVHNSLWKGGSWVIDVNGKYRVTGPVIDGSIVNYHKIEVDTTADSVKLYLLLNNYSSFESKSLRYRFHEFDTPILITKKEIGSIMRFDYYDFISKVWDYFTKELSLGVNALSIGNTVYGYALVLLKKTSLVFDLDYTCTVGVINKVPLGVDVDYLPGRDLVDEDSLDINIIYNDEILPVYYDETLNDYCFDLDLTDKIDNKPVKLNVQVNEIDLVNPSLHEVSLKCNYPRADSFSELQSEIANGAEIIELTNNITFESNLIIPHDLYLIGDGNTVNLSKFHVIVSLNTSVKIEGAHFQNGESCFVQKTDSTLNLITCTFVNAKITDNYKGSVVASNNETSITTITGCTFTNCHHTLYSGGELTVKDSRALYTDWNDSLDPDYSAFLNAFAGNITVTGSVFDIDYQDKTINTEEINYALSLIGLSTDCTFNNFTANQFASNDKLPFFDNPYNNLSHVYVPFYHPVIEEVVVASPILGKEDKSVCHRLLGTDWVYKNNTQITRITDANNIQKIRWEDI